MTAVTYTGPRIDCDVHHTWRTEADLLAYLPERWRELVGAPAGSRRAPVPLVPQWHFDPFPGGIYTRTDSWPESGGPPGSDYDTLRRQLLDPLNIEHAILSYDIGQNTGVANVYLASALARAANDWTIDHWLSRDDRLSAAILLPTQDIAEAVAEIERLGDDPRFVQALIVVNGTGKPLGHPVYHPIYEAAVARGLPVAYHIGGENWVVAGAQQNPGAIMSSHLEWHALIAQPPQHYLVSLLVHGVFEKFPGLRVVIEEAGVAWIPWLLWELDANVDAIRAESPWVKRLPSEYFREHVRVTTQPLDSSPERSGLVRLLEAFGGFEDLLLFATDYPHWDQDEPDYVAGRLPRSWWPKLFVENARQLYRWS
jgi:uncharacterized protein